MTKTLPTRIGQMGKIWTLWLSTRLQHSSGETKSSSYIFGVSRTETSILCSLQALWRSCYQIEMDTIYETMFHMFIYQCDMQRNRTKTTLMRHSGDVRTLVEPWAPRSFICVIHRGNASCVRVSWQVNQQKQGYWSALVMSRVKARSWLCNCFCFSLFFYSLGWASRQISQNKATEAHQWCQELE